eukprot:scaffold43209_cov35-Phaeocystis_antarctica.AAC.2
MVGAEILRAPPPAPPPAALWSPAELPPLPPESSIWIGAGDCQGRAGVDDERVVAEAARRRIRVQRQFRSHLKRR